MRVTFQSQKTVDFVFSPDDSRLSEKKFNGALTMRTPAQARSVVDKASTPTPASSSPDEMSLAPNWLPHNVHARKQREYPMQNPTFEDGCNRFKCVSFICDRDSRIIGIQLVDPSLAQYPCSPPLS
ncbi:MAG: hypothetical protein KDK97_23765 [Verrucomicrobiales bacterium]|nr:hypothetical protein [Verrucomicrobiales bacterium]